MLNGERDLVVSFVNLRSGLASQSDPAHTCKLKCDQALLCAHCLYPVQLAHLSTFPSLSIAMFKENKNGSRHNKLRSPLGEEECQDKTCSDAKSSFQNWMRNHPRKEDPECPLDRETLGKYTWSLLHTIAAKYPMRPTNEEKDEMKEFIRIFANLYPCSYCAHEFRKDLKIKPPQLDSRNALSLWFCQIHNQVNERLNKPQFDCSKVDERWRTGWKDGSCT